jgi:20S proteasome subunit alpha 2
MSDASYSFSLTTFSPSGKLLQIEHALKAVEQGKTALGIQATDGVVLATEKKLPSTLIDESTVQKIQVLADHVGVIYAGMGPDFRLIVRSAQKKAVEYFLVYKEPIPVLQLTREIATLMQEYTQQGGVRPFGVSLLVAGVDDDGPQLFQVDPSGAYFGWRASAIGRNFTSAKTFLERRYSEEMESGDAVHTALLTLREGFEGEMTSTNVEVGMIDTATKRFRVLVPDEVKDFLAEAV